MLTFLEPNSYSVDFAIFEIFLHMKYETDNKSTENAAEMLSSDIFRSRTRLIPMFLTVLRGGLNNMTHGRPVSELPIGAVQ